MRSSGLPDFRKLWGRVEHDMPSGNYTLVINNTYNVTPFHGDKMVVFATANDFGGKNPFLSITYIVMGSVFFLMGFIFWYGYKKFGSVLDEEKL